MSPVEWILFALVGGPIVVVCLVVTAQNLRALWHGEDLRAPEGWKQLPDEREAPR